MTQETPWLTTSRIAWQAKKSQSTIANWIRAGVLRPDGITAGGTRLFSQVQVDRVIRERAGR